MVRFVIRPFFFAGGGKTFTSGTDARPFIANICKIIGIYKLQRSKIRNQGFEMIIRVLMIVGLLAAFVSNSLAAPTRVPGRLFMQGSEAASADVTLARFHDRRIRVFDQQIAYRNDRKACMQFELPAELPSADLPLRMELEAYNDDRTYSRAVWIEVDGIGGYLAVQRVAAGQYHGSGTIDPGERKRWALPLDNLPISLEGKKTAQVDLDKVLRQPGPHTICAWISTYAQYGPKSWITLDVVGSPAPGASDQKTGTGSAAALAGSKQPRRKPARPDPCSRWTWDLKDRNLKLALRQNPDTKDLYDQTVCSILEVSATRDTQPDFLIHRFDLIADEPRMPGYLLDYKFSDYIRRSGIVVLQRAKALRLYNLTNHRLSPLVGPRECVAEDAQSSNIERTRALADGAFLYGVAVSCHPFLISTDRPKQLFSYLETIGTFVLFADEAGGLVAAEPETTDLFRFTAKAGRDARFSLTYFLNEQGMKAYRQKEYMRAAKWFNRAAAVAPPDYLYPHTNLAGSLALERMPKEAMAQLRRACALDPSFTRSRMLSDSDFDSLRNYTQFGEILHGVCAED